MLWKEIGCTASFGFSSPLQKKKKEKRNSIPRHSRVVVLNQKEGILKSSAQKQKPSEGFEAPALPNWAETWWQRWRLLPAQYLCNASTSVECDWLCSCVFLLLPSLFASLSLAHWDLQTWVQHNQFYQNTHYSWNPSIGCKSPFLNLEPVTQECTCKNGACCVCLCTVQCVYMCDLHFNVLYVHYKHRWRFKRFLCGSLKLPTVFGLCREQRQRMVFMSPMFRGGRS